MDRGAPPDSGRLVEKIEVLRTKLRLAQQLGRPDIERLLEDVSSLRSSVLSFTSSRHLRSLERLRDAPVAAPASPGHRALDLGFEGVLGDSPGIIDALELVRRAAPTPLPATGTCAAAWWRCWAQSPSRAWTPRRCPWCGRTW